MNTPTNDDLKRMVDEAPKAPVEPSSPRAILEELSGLVGVMCTFITRPAYAQWTVLRELALRAMWLCGLLAWEAGKRMTPQDPPTSAETPKAKSAPDVEALLRECDMLADCNASAERRTLFRNLAAALRAERERAERATETAGLTYARAFDLQEHLRAVLRTGWAHSAMAPSVVQKARAFLEDPSAEQPMGPNRTRYALRCADLRAREAEAERDALRAKLAAEDEAHGFTRADLAKAKRELEEAQQDRNAADRRVSAYNAENLDLRAKNLELVQRVEGLEKKAAGYKDSAEHHMKRTDLAEVALAAAREQMRNLEATCLELAKRNAKGDA